MTVHSVYIQSGVRNVAQSQSLQKQISEFVTDEFLKCQRLFFVCNQKTCYQFKAALLDFFLQLGDSTTS